MERSYKKDVSTIFLLLVYLVISVYYLPSLLKHIPLLLLLYLAYKTDKDYVSFAFFFIVIETPGKLFVTAEFYGENSFPDFPLFPGLTLTYKDIFFLLMFYKAIKKKENYDSIIKKDVFILSIFIILILLYSLILGMNFDNTTSTLRILFPWTLLYTLPILFQNEEKIKKLTILLYPIVILNLIFLIYTFISGKYPGFIFTGSTISPDVSLDDLSISEELSDVARPNYSFILVLYCLCTALFYMSKKENDINNKYLAVIVAISVYLIFMSATRGWFITVLIIFLFFILTQNISSTIGKGILLTIFTIIIIFIVQYFVPSIGRQVDLTIERLSTIFLVAEGDVTAGGTLSRIDLRTPIVLRAFYESPVFGWGFSDKYFDFSDGHVGIPNLLLNVGLIGFLILNFYFIKWTTIIHKYKRYLNIDDNFKNALRFLPAIFISIYIINISSTSFWGIDMGFYHSSKVFYVCLVMAYFNTIVKDNITTNNL